MHPGTGINSGTVANGLAYHFQKLSNINGDLRPGIVHRLDKDTSGVMVMLKPIVHILSWQISSKIGKLKRSILV